MLGNTKMRNPFPMIGKVFKYEFKSGSKTLLPIYGIMLVLALLFRIFFSESFSGLTPDGVRVTLALLLFVTCFTAFIITIILIEKRFKKGMLEDEAYLNLSLPVTMSEHIVGRLLTFSVWFLLYTAASFLTGLIIISGEIIDIFSIAEIREFFQNFYEECNVHFSTFMVTETVYALSVMLLFIMFIMFVNVLSHLVKKNRTIVEVVIVVVIFVVFINIIKLIMGPVTSSMGTTAFRAFYSGIWKLVIVNFAFVVISVIATQAIMNFKLNLE